MVLSVSTVTPVLNDAMALPVAIASIQAQEDVLIERIVIAIGPSSDQSGDVARAIAEEDARVVLVENPSGRTPRGLNLAIKEAASDVIVRVDARAVLPIDYVRNALETLEMTSAGNVGAAQVPVGRTRSEAAIAAAMRSSFGSGGAAYRRGGNAQPVDTAWLGVFRRTALVDVGGYDEAFIRNQDAELNARLNTAGHEVWFDPRLRVEYTPRSSMSGLAKQYFQYGWWRLRTVRKHPHTLKFRQLAAPLVVLALVVSFVLGVLTTPFMFLVAVGYGCALLVVGCVSEGGIEQRVLTSVALVAMHLSWGCGFLLSALQSLFQRGST